MTILATPLEYLSFKQCTDPYDTKEVRAHDDVISAALQAKVPLCLWGEQGMGKATTMETLAAKLDLACVRLSLSGFSDERDIAPTEPWFHHAFASGTDMLLLIELNGRLDRGVTERLVALAANRRVGESKIPDGARLVFTGIPQGDRTLDQGVSKELSRYLLQLDFVRMDPDQWQRWVSLPPKLVTDTFELNPEIADAVSEAARSSVAHFLGGKRDWPFSWKMVAEILPYLHDDQARSLALKGLVGEWSAEKFLARKQALA